MEENNQNQQPQGLQIELKPEIGVGVYANLQIFIRFISFSISQKRDNGLTAIGAVPGGSLSPAERRLPCLPHLLLALSNSSR